MNVMPSSWLAQAENGGVPFFSGLTGPQFLGGYALWFLVVFGLVLFLRWRGINTPVLTGVGLVVYELPAVLRIAIFSDPTMHKWGFLIAMMVLGGFAFLLRIQHTDDSGETKNRWWSNHCSSTTSGAIGGISAVLAVAAAVVVAGGAAAEVVGAVGVEVNHDWTWLSPGTGSVD